MFRSVKSRITFTCIFLFGTLFICQIALLYSFMRVDMKQHENRMLYEMYYGMQEMIRDSGLKEIQAILKREKHPGPMMHFLRVLDGHGKMLLSSNMSNWPEIQMPDNLSTVTVDTLPAIQTSDTQSSLGTIAYILGMPVEGYILQVGHVQNNVDPFFEHFVKIALILLPITLCLVGLAGWFVSRQALNGVKQVTRIAATINRGKLDLRVEVGNSGLEIQELASNFNTMLAKIQTLIRELEDVTNNIAHDLRSPLTRLRGIIETTLRADPTAETYHQMSAQLIEEIERLQELINTMLQIASAEAGIDRAEMGPVNLNGILEDAVELFELIAEDRQQQLTLSLPHHSVVINGSLSRLQRVIANLLDNATKFTPVGGSIRLCLRQPDPRQVIIEVSDTGPGIDPAIRPYIFDRFYRGDQSRTCKGNGLGLSYVRSIVQAHHGQITVTCAESQSAHTGSLFTITLPVDPTAANAVQ